MYLKLKFKNARLYRNHRGSKSKNVQTYQDERGKTMIEKCDRKDLGNFVEPISVFQISNVIHKIFGKRPVPYFRKVVYKRDEYLFEKAKESLLYIRPHYVDKKGNNRFLKETMRVTKSDHNAWKNNGHISWERVRYFLSYDENKLNILKGYFEKVLKEQVTEEKTFIYYCDKLRPMINSLNKQFFLSNRLTPIYEYIKKDNLSDINRILSGGKIGNTINFGVHPCETLDGEILVPVTEEDLENIRKYSKGTAKILDGGYVEIVGVVRNISRRDMDKYTIVSDLSEEIKYLT